MTISNVTFSTDLILRRKREDTKGFNFYLEREYWVNYEKDGEEVEYSVPRGFGTDLASVPALLRWLASKVDAIEASIIHDHAYEFKTVPREEADDLFRAIMIASKKSWFKRNLMWLGVRVGGWVVYRRVHIMNAPSIGEEWE